MTGVQTCALPIYAYIREIEEFFAAIKGKEPLYSFEKDKEILKVIDKIEDGVTA